MAAVLPESSALRVSQITTPPVRSDVDRLDHLLIIIKADSASKALRQLPDGRRLSTLARRAGKQATLHHRLANARATGMSVIRLKGPGKGDPVSPAYSRLVSARKAVSDALRDNPRSLGVWVSGFEPKVARELVQGIILAVGAARFEMPAFSDARKKPSSPPAIKIFGQKPRLDLARVRAEVEAVNLTRWLTALPPNRLDAAAYTRAVRELATEHGWSLRVLDEKRLKKLGAGAFLAVAQGNANRDACILHLRYRPGAKSDRPALALVGKGIVFDTGGTNLKPFKAMLDMHEDMAGSAVALATLLALTRLSYSEPVDCWLAVTENRLSAEAYKSRDVVTAANGVTIEIIHTDAEGRMVLADALALAGEAKPQLIMDFATLTGSCVHALTERYSGVFTNRHTLGPALIEVGRRCGERVWPFPLDGDFDEDIRSKVADVAQCSPGAGADQILAARFLQRFVPASSAWVHMDLSSATRKSGLAQVSSGPTGFGVRYALSLLLDNAELLQADQVA